MTHSTGPDIVSEGDQSRELVWIEPIRERADDEASDFLRVLLEHCIGDKLRNLIAFLGSARMPVTHGPDPAAILVCRRAKAFHGFQKRNDNRKRGFRIQHALFIGVCRESYIASGVIQDRRGREAARPEELQRPEQIECLSMRNHYLF